MLGSIQTRLRRVFQPSTSEVPYTPLAVDPDASADVEPAEATPLRERRQVQAPRDVYLCFWLLGAGVLLPWNALICTFPLLTSFFPEGDTRNSLPSYLSTTFCFANLFFLGLAQRNVSSVSPVTRLRWSLFLLLVSTVAMAYPILPAALPALSNGGSGGIAMLLPLLLVLTLMLAFTCSYLQSACIALAALWGSNETLAVMSGQGGIAVLVSGAQAILEVLNVSRVKVPEAGGSSISAASILWALSAGWVVVCIWALHHLTAHPAIIDVLAPLTMRTEGGVDRAKNGRVTRLVARKNIRLEFAVAFAFIVTLSIFPPITTTIVSVQDPPPKYLQPAVFIALHFFLFNVGDYTGRTYLPSVGFRFVTIPRIVMFSLARVIFVPLFLFCNIPARAKYHLVAIPDLFYFIILFAFGLTNGWVSTLCMMFASSPDLNPAITTEEKDIAGTLAAFCLVFGLATGSLCSFMVSYWIKITPFDGFGG